MITLGLIALCAFLYWLGGQDRCMFPGADTKFRDIGCPVCMLGLAWFALGWSWWLLGLGISCFGFAIGDHGKWYWTPHAFVIGLGMLPFTIANNDWLCFGLMMAVVVAGTYAVSKWLSMGGIDVFARGVLYATIPLWFLIGG